MDPDDLAGWELKFDHARTRLGHAERGLHWRAGQPHDIMRITLSEDLMQELGRLELQASGYVKHGDVPQEDV